MIDFYNSSGQMLGTTSKKISGLIITEELERGWVANVELPLNHPCAQYVNEENSVKIDGQMYDIVAITEYTGEQNLISFECEHRSYRLNDVMVESFTNLGTAANTLSKLLQGTSFTAGSVPTTGTEAFSIADPVTIRNAIYQLAYVHNWEVKWDNNVVNLVVRLGADRGKVFEYTRDLKNITRTIDKRQKDDNGNYKATYEIEVVSLFRSGQGDVNDYFELGDNVTVKDSISNRTFNTRIVKYERDLINPTNDRIELNSFVGDIYDDTINLITDIDSNFSDINGNITNMTAEIAKSLKNGQRYNNVSISTADGFKAERASDGLKVLMNAYDCFKIQKSDGSYIFYVDDSGQAVTKGSFTTELVNGISCEVSGGRITFYIDGAECGTIKLSGSNNGYGITIQGTGGNGAYINGKLYVNGEAQCSTLSTSSIISSGYSGLNTSVNVTTPSGTKGMTFKNGVLTNVY